MLKITTNLHNNLIDRLGDGNPQLFRELKGRLTLRNVGFTIAISAIGQIFLLLLYLSFLPISNTEYNRYCTGYVRHEYYGYIPPCRVDYLGETIVNWQLWWLDLFVGTSIIAIFVLLVAGTYLLVADLSKEESRGTLNFIRLSPQSAQSILAGKMLGVPSLVYLMVALALPLHFGAGLSAGIPFDLILIFYGILIASCTFFYSAALLYGSIGSEIVGFKTWSASVIVLFFLFFMTAYSMNSYMNNTWGNSVDWVTLFYPGRVLSFLVDATSIPIKDIGYLIGNRETDLLWYGQPLWKYAGIGISFVFLNYALWTYWIWQGLVRRFHNSNATVLSKGQSYWFSGCFVAMTLGFTLQSNSSHQLYSNYGILECLLLIFFLGLIAALSPHRQTLQDWARYRHRASANNRSLIKDLIWGEKSPSTVAIAINLLIATGYILPSLWLFPLKKYATPVFFSLILSAGVILIYALVAQLILFMKTPKRVIWASVTVSSLMIFPLICFALFSIRPQSAPELWLFSLFPLAATEYASNSTIFFSILGQWLAIALFGFKMTKQLQKTGESETKALLSGRIARN